MTIAVWVIASLLAIVLALALVYQFVFNPYRGTSKDRMESMPLDESISLREAVQDLDYVMEMFRTRHPAWLEEDNGRVRDVESQYLTELQYLDSLGRDEITVLEEWQMISRVMQRLHDGHSQIYVTYDGERYIDDFSQVRQYGPPVLIDEEPYEAVFERFLAIFPYETESYAKALFDETILFNESYLRWIGVDTSDGADYTFDTGEGLGQETVHYDFVTIEWVKGYKRQAPENPKPWVYFEIDKENGIGIFTLTECNYNEEYKNTVRDFFGAVREAGIGHIIVDLRYNGGGNSMVGDEFLRYLDIDGYYGWPCDVRYGPILYRNAKPYNKNRRLEPQYTGDIYVLTNQRTFSAAMDFTMYIMDNDLGVVVGEESGNLPDSYGDLLGFHTPNTRLQFSISYKRWYRIDETKAGQPLIPDYPCDAAEAMEEAYRLILE